MTRATKVQESVWVTMSIDGKTQEVRATVVEWGTFANQGKPLVSVPGHFAFYANRWKRIPNQICRCPTCLAYVKAGRQAPHGMGDDPQPTRISRRR